MTTYYLMVTEWRDGKIVPEEGYRLTRQTSGTRKKAEEAGQRYENELNDAQSHNEVLEKIALTGKGYAVCAIPYSQAREYLSFMSWENCEEYQGKKENDKPK